MTASGRNTQSAPAGLARIAGTGRPQSRVNLALDARANDGERASQARAAGDPLVPRCKLESATLPTRTGRPRPARLPHGPLGPRPCSGQIR